MKVEFTKYQGTGNDFVIIDKRKLVSDLSLADIQKLCKRRFGIGADGLIIIDEHKEFDFQMMYFNADGSRSFCGNGARCAVHFAYKNRMFDKSCSFLAIDGKHEAEILPDGRVKLRMKNVNTVEKNESGNFIINTGSPHYIKFTENLDQEDILSYGKLVRYSHVYKKEGINVNLAEEKDGFIQMQTYERGVEDETFSCGTGATAVALAFRQKQNISGVVSTKLKVKGGELEVLSKKVDDSFNEIFLIGPAKSVFHGKIKI